MFQQHFYHEKIRKCVATFGTMFNNLYVVRKDGAGNAIDQMKVPLAYAPKQKFLDRINQSPDLEDERFIAIKLPRMSFEISSMYYDPVRQLPKVNSFSEQDDTGTVRKKFYTSVPYIINFQLNILSKTNEDAVQIVEQILPYFNPAYTVTMRQFSDYPDIKEDIPISLIGISYSDDYDGALESRRTIIYTLDFEMKTAFYGPISTSSIIRKAIVDFRDPDVTDEVDPSVTDDIMERIIVEPFPLDAESLDSVTDYTISILNPGNGDSL